MVGLELGVVDLGFRNWQRKGFGVLLELKGSLMSYLKAIW